MRSFMLGVFCGLLILAACAKGGKPVRVQPRQKTDKRFLPCTLNQVKNPEGKFCNRTCVKKKKKKCTEYKITVLDMAKKEDWSFMRDAGFACLDFDQVL